MSTAEKTPSASLRYLDALTGIRGLAAWMVVLYHLRDSLKLLLSEWVLASLAKGYLAVDLFFMLSGFVLWYNYADRLREFSLPSIADFYWRRIARIWPLHIAILFGFMLFALRSHGTTLENHIYSYTTLPLHVILIQGWGTTDSLTWNPPAWSISAELAAYLLFPIVAGFAWLRRLSFGKLAGLALCLLIALHLLFALNGRRTLGADIPNLGLWRCLLEFSLGNLICIAWQRYSTVGRAAMVSFSAAAAALAIGLACGLPETVFVPVALVFCLFTLSSGSGFLVTALSARPLIFLGEISYSTYLSHVFLFSVFKLFFVDQSMQINWIEFASFLVLVFAVSVFLYWWVEKPAQRWLNLNKPSLGTAKAPQSEMKSAK